MDLPLQIDGFSGISLLHRASNASYYAARDPHGEARLLVVFELRRGMALEEQRDAFSLRARFEAPQLEVLRGPATLGRVWGFLRSQPGVVYDERGGISLATWLARNPGPIALAQALDFVIQLVEVLVFAHGRGVLHRALSPSTIWVEDQAELRLRRVFGFGFANLLEAEQSWSRTGTMLGEVEWMAPEQFLGTDLSPSTDLYTAGLLLYRLATGTPAVEGTSVYRLVQAHCNPEIAPPSPALGISPQLLALIERAMQREPAFRYTQALDLLTALRAEAKRVTQALPAMHGTLPQHFGNVTASDVGVKRQGPADEGAPSVDGAPTPKQDFYAPQQATAERRWVPGNATAVDRKAVLDARDVDQAERPSKATPPPQNVTTRRPRRRLGVVLASAATVIAVIGGVFWFYAESTDPAAVQQRAVQRAETPAVVGLSDRFCAWDAEQRKLEVGREVVIRYDGRRIVVAYDGESVDVSRIVSNDEVRIARVHAPNGAALYHRRFPSAARDWIFILPVVLDHPEPKLWGFQFHGVDLVTQHQLPLATGPLEDAHLSLPRVGPDCLLQVRVRAPSSTGTPAPPQVMRLRFVEQGLVVESGALGQLYATTP